MGDGGGEQDDSDVDGAVGEADDEGIRRKERYDHLATGEIDDLSETGGLCTISDPLARRGWRAQVTKRKHDTPGLHSWHTSVDVSAERPLP